MTESIKVEILEVLILPLPFHILFHPQSTLLGFKYGYLEYEKHESPLIDPQDANFLSLHQCSQGVV